MSRVSPDIRRSLAEVKGGLTWILPVAIVVALGGASVAGYFIYKALTYTDPEALQAAPPGKENVPTIEENKASIHRPVFWKVAVEGLPEGAELYVEDSLHPERPVVLEGHKSPYSFRVQADGYVTWAGDVEVHSDLTLSIPMLTHEEAARQAAEAARKKKHRGSSSSGETESGPTELDFSTGGAGEGESVKKKKKGKLGTGPKPTSKNLDKLL